MNEHNLVTNDRGNRATDTLPLLAITMGDINGIGPEVIAKAFTGSSELWTVCRPIVLGSVEAYEHARSLVEGSVSPMLVDSLMEPLPDEPALPFLRLERRAPLRRPAVLDPEAAKCAMEWIRKAVDMTLHDEVDGLVTCPIHKQGIHEAGYSFRGHTDFIAELCGVEAYRMGLFAGPFRVVHNSDHVSLRQALGYINRAHVEETIRIGARALEQLGLPRRHIAVAGLNPHAGEAGAFGAEEQDVIAPAIASCRAAGLDCSGPHPPDAVFRLAVEGRADLIVAMYHDQGHIPVKLVARDQGVNVTLGLPIVRTSVAHGTAYDIAGTAQAVETSLCAAVALAAELTRGRQRISA